MDLAQTTSLTTLFPAAMTVIGTLIGAGIAGFVALRVVRAQTQTQREIARDAARRERRDKQVSPLLEHANFVYSHYHRVAEFARYGQWDNVRATMQVISSGDEPLLRVGWSALRRSHPGAYSMLDASSAELAAQNVCWATANRLLAAIPNVPSELIDQLHLEANV